MTTNSLSLYQQLFKTIIVTSTNIYGLLSYVVSGSGVKFCVLTYTTNDLTSITDMNTNTNVCNNWNMAATRAPRWGGGDYSDKLVMVLHDEKLSYPQAGTYFASTYFYGLCSTTYQRF